jgi:hypothetical protein
LCHNSKSIFEESDDNEEAPYGRKMGAEWLGIDVDPVFDLCCECSELANWVVLKTARRGVGI